MKVNPENLFVATGVLKGLNPPPPPATSKTLNITPQSDLLHSKNIFTVKFRTSWTAPNNFQQHVL